MRTIAVNPCKHSVDSGLYIHVVAAAIKKDDKILLARRPPHLHQGDKWEFPGGKVETDETAEQALVRELREELNITPTSYRPLITVRHQYVDKNIKLDVWLVEEFEGEAEGKEGQLVIWVRHQDLGQYKFPEANKPVLPTLELPQTCAITPAALTIDKVVMSQVTSRISTHPMILLRAPLLARGQYRDLAEQFAVLTKDSATKLLLNSNAESVYQLDAAGLHFSSRRLMNASARPIGKDKYFSATCQSSKDLEQAKRMDADFIFVAPVKSTASLPHAKALGWTDFSLLCDRINRPVYALGGVSGDDLFQAWKYGAQGVAGISEFWK